MRIDIRPSKITFYKRLESFSKRVRPNASLLDFASSYFRYACFFPNVGTYVGADIDKAALAKGKKMYPRKNYIAKNWDLLKRPNSREKFDYVVCTHAFWYLSSDEHKAKATQNLLYFTKKGGSLFFNSPLERDTEEKLDEVLNGAFRKIVKKKYRRWILSSWEDCIIEKHQWHGKSVLLDRILYSVGIFLYLIDVFGKETRILYDCETRR